jgi:hypothetical protein
VIGAVTGWLGDQKREKASEPNESTNELQTAYVE